MNRLAPQLFSLLLLASLIAPAAASASGLDDPYLDQAWQEQVSGIAALRAAGGDGHGVTVGIIDSGFDLTHEDLDGIDLLYLSPTSGEPFALAHGTATLSLLAAESDNGVGSAGVAPRARILAQATSLTDDTQLISYMNGLADRGARLISISVAYQAPIAGSELEDAYKALRDRGVLVIAAAGNYGESDIRIYPSRLNSVISVGAHNQVGQWTSFSNQSAVWISAPGLALPVSQPNNSYKIGLGTSYATPIVAGVIAALLSLDPTLTTEGALALLLESAVGGADGLLRIDGAAALAILNSGTSVARITEWPRMPRTSLAQMVSLRAGTIGAVAECQVVVSLAAASLIRDCETPLYLSLGELLGELGSAARSGTIKAELRDASGVRDSHLFSFNLDLAPYDPEPDDLIAPSITRVPGSAWISGTNRRGATEVEITDNRPLRKDGVYCRLVHARARAADGTVGAWKTLIEETMDFPYREPTGRSLTIRLPSHTAPAPGRIEWSVECADSSGNFAPIITTAVAVPFEGPSLRWSRGNYTLPRSFARGAALAATKVSATISRSGFGRRLALIGSTGAGYGKIRVTIDGRASCTIDLGRTGSGAVRPQRNQVTLLGPGSTCGGVRLSSLSNSSTIHRVTIRSLPQPGRLVVPIDAIAFW